MVGRALALTLIPVDVRGPAVLQQRVRDEHVVDAHAAPLMEVTAAVVPPLLQQRAGHALDAVLAGTGATGAEAGLDRVPGAMLMTMKVMSVMPNSVGIIATIRWRR